MLSFIYVAILSCSIFNFVSIVSCNSPLASYKLYTYRELRTGSQRLSLPDQSLTLIGEDGDYIYLGARDAVYQIQASSMSACVKVVSWPQQPATPKGGQVRSLYFSGPGVAFACADAGVGGSVTGVGRCYRFDRPTAGASCAAAAAPSAADCLWRLSAAAAADSASAEAPNTVNRRAILLPPCASGGGDCPPPVFHRRAGSHVFFAALPPIRDTTDLVELVGPEFADIGFTTADLYSRRNRALWIARGARALRMHETAGRLYVVYTEEAAETSNYVESVNSERHGLVKNPTFTRLGRVCLNDPGQTLGNQTSPRVLTSYFKLRLICRDNDTDYDVMQLASEVSSDGHFYGLFSPQNSPPGGYLALCRFSIADAEASLTGGEEGADGGDLIEMSRPDWQSPWSAHRLTRAQFRERSELRRPFDCDWTPSEARRTKLKDLHVERMAPLLARPLIARNLRTLPPTTTRATRRHGGGGGVGRRRRRLTALTLLPAQDGAEEQLLMGWDTGEVARLSPSNPSVAIEILEALPPGEAVEALRVRAVAGDGGGAGLRRLLAFGASSVASLPLTRCSRAATCGDCGGLGDPLCAWDAAGGVCADRAELPLLRGGAPSGVECPEGGGGRSFGGRNRTAVYIDPDEQPHHPSGGEGGGSPLSAASLGGGGGGGVGSDGVSVAVLVGVLLPACMVAFAIGAALGWAVKARKKPRALAASGRLLVKGFAIKSKSQRQRPPPTSSTQSSSLAASDQRQQHQHQQRRGGGLSPAASSPLMAVSTAPTAECRQGNDYVQAADLLGIVALAKASSRASSWESCVSDSAGPQDAVGIAELPRPSSSCDRGFHSQQKQQQQQQHQVKVNAGFIGQICLSVDLNGGNS